MNVLTVVFAGIAALGGLGGLGTILVVRAQGRKLNAEAKKHGVDADLLVTGEWRTLYFSVAADAKDAQRRAAACESRQNALEDHVNVLNQKIRELGGDPPPFRYPLLNIAGGEEA